jgi:YesN/AraC family two-component response regulator
MIKENILIVDDDIYSTRLLSEFLSIKGMNPSVCYNGKEALEEFNRKKYPIVITDIEMPVMGGVELIERIKSINEDTVIIILSAHADSSLYCTDNEIRCL